MKITKDYLKKIIKEELEAALGDYPDQDKVFIKCNLSGPEHRRKPGDDQKDYYIEIPVIFLQNPNFKSSSQVVTSGTPKTRKNVGFNGFSREGKDYFDKFEGGKFKKLTIDYTSGGIQWTVVKEDDLPEILRLSETKVNNELANS